MTKVNHRYINFCFRHLFFLWVFISPLCFSQVRIGRNLIIRSDILDREVKYSVMLPASYHIGTKEYPVIYLLHGFGGNHEGWLNRCNIAQLVDSMIRSGDLGEFIYIMPDAGNSYYINNYDNSNAYNDFFIRELIPAIDSLFRTKDQKESRILMGLSMGGYGSIVLALKKPEFFGSVIALSPAVRDQNMFENMAQERYDSFFGPVYGNGRIREERITQHWKENSPYFLIDSVSAHLYFGINWYLDCGLYDDLLPASEAFHELLLSYRIPHEFHIRPGAHNWSYWYTSAVNGLMYLNAKLSPANL